MSPESLLVVDRDRLRVETLGADLGGQPVDRVGDRASVAPSLPSDQDRLLHRLGEAPVRLVLSSNFANDLIAQLVLGDDFELLRIGIENEELPGLVQEVNAVSHQDRRSIGCAAQALFPAA